MKERVEIQKTFSVSNCKANPHKVFVFGDNLVHKGTAGQAVIRHCFNSFGIPTKKYPSMNKNAFFSDKEIEITRVQAALGYLYDTYNNKYKPIIVFPENGLGTGLAKLKSKSPEIYRIIGNFLCVHFDVDIMP